MMGTVTFLALSVLAAAWVTRLIRPWPQWAVAFGFVILLVLISGSALVAGLMFA